MRSATVRRHVCSSHLDVTGQLGFGHALRLGRRQPGGNGLLGGEWSPRCHRRWPCARPRGLTRCWNAAPAVESGPTAPRRRGPLGARGDGGARLRRADRPTDRNRLRMCPAHRRPRRRATRSARRRCTGPERSARRHPAGRLPVHHGRQPGLHWDWVPLRGARHGGLHVPHARCRCGEPAALASSSLG